MSISLKIQKMLWGRAANRCAICRVELSEEAKGADEASIIGEACHIVAESPNGPRGNSPLSAADRNLYPNLILLCNVHHKIVDDQVESYPTENLLATKSDHEQWVRVQLNFDAQKQFDEESYGDIVDGWVDRLALDDWERWASPVVCNGQPSLATWQMEALRSTCVWLFSRAWPSRYPVINEAFTNFRLVANDFCSVFDKFAKPLHDGLLETERFYRIKEWDPERYEVLVRRFERHVDLVTDLMFELSRAVNYVCESVRKHLRPDFRTDEGASLLTSGPDERLRVTTYRPEYRAEDGLPRPYPGLTEFEAIRFTRDVHFGRWEDGEVS